jgi:CheY-like chemotaxis protein
MGLLAGGIAHDFNNLLTSAVGHLELAKLQVSDPKEVGESLSMIDQALVQMTGLARQLQTYSGRARTNLKPVDLNQAIASVTAILRVSAGKHCTFELDLAPHPMVVLGEVTQLQQIVMNLVINAAEAMGERGGTIKVTTRASHVGEVPAALRGNLADGPLAQLQVTDTGPGMPEHVRARVFEPFFSSKANGRGLGLAVVTGAVKSHGGVIDLESELGKGASFRMWLPLRPELKVEEERPTHALPKQAIKGKVLLVDDEDSVRKMVARAVSMRGATVIEAENGQIAVDKLKSEGDIALIIMDIVMPVLGGVDAFLKMRELGFQTPVILMSGFAERQVLDRLGDDRPIAMLRKPFRPAELLKHVEDVLK